MKIEDIAECNLCGGSVDYQDMQLTCTSCGAAKSPEGGLKTELDHWVGLQPNRKARRAQEAVLRRLRRHIKRQARRERLAAQHTQTDGSQSDESGSGDGEVSDPSTSSHTG